MKKTIVVLIVIMTIALLFNSCSEKRINALEGRLAYLENNSGEKIATDVPDTKSEARLSELESRISYLEQYLLSETSEEIGPSEKGTDSEANHDPTQTPASTEVNGRRYSYLLEGKTADEIVSICDMILSNIPQKGQTYEEYRASLIAEPFSSNNRTYIFVDSYEYTEPYKEALVEINVYGTQYEMNGTIGYGNSSIDIRASIAIQGYERAEEIYDKLFELLSVDYVDVQNKKESTTWFAKGLNERTYTYVTFLQMSVSYGGFGINIERKHPVE